MKKINWIGTGIVFFLTFGFINWYEVLRGPKDITMVDQTLFEDFDTTLAVVVGLLVAFLFAALTYRVDKRADHELLRDFVFDRLNDSEKEALIGLNDYEKNCFYLAYEETFEEDVKSEYESFVSEVKTKSKHDRFFKKIGALVATILIVFTLYPTYTDYVQAQEAYAAQVAQAEVEAEALRQQQEAEYNQIIEDQILYYDGLPAINLVSGNTFKKGDVEKYINDYIRTQPQFLFNNCKMINLCTDDTFLNFCNQMGMSTNLGDFGETYAFAHSSNMNIYLRLHLDEEDGVVWQKHTVTHELSHIYDYSYGNQYTWKGISDSQSWVNLYSQYGSLISDYATYERQEGWADAAAMYVESPDELKQISMEVFNFVNSYYQMY